MFRVYASVVVFFFCVVFFFEAEDGIRDLVRSRGLGDVYKRQVSGSAVGGSARDRLLRAAPDGRQRAQPQPRGTGGCLLYTSDAADERSSGDLGGRRTIKKKNNTTQATYPSA